MEWMIGKYYEFCDQDFNIKFQGEVLKVSELAIQIQHIDRKLTLPTAIYSRLVAIEATETKPPMSVSEPELESNLDDTTHPVLLSEKQVAELIGMSRSFLRQSRMEGNRKNRTEAPPFIRVGRAVRYKSSDIKDWIDCRKNNGNSVAK